VKRRVVLSVPRTFPATAQSRAIVAEVERRVEEQMALNDRFIWRSGKQS